MDLRRTVIVPLDAHLNTCLDPVAVALEAAGFAVHRPAILDPAAWSGDLPQADVVVLTPRTRMSRAELTAAERLKGIVFPTIGVEALDLAAATDMGLAVGFGATDAAVSSIAEANVMLIAAMLLDLNRKARSLREDGWRRGTINGRMVEGKIIGFVGFGRIARATAHRLTNWGTTIRFYDPHVPSDAGAAWQAERIDRLDDLLRESDVVVVMAELTTETTGMIGHRQFGLMRPDAVLINTARGALVDEAALVQALAERRIAGAALDAFSVEPLPPQSPLRRLENVILTPHCVGHTEELHRSFVPAAVENVTRIAADKAPLYFKNPQVLRRWRARLARLAAS